MNVNDSDLDPDMKELPEERVGFTDMTFCLIRFEVANIFRRILYIPPGPNRCTEFFASLSIAEKEKWISECHQRLEDKYLSNCDMSIPLYWVTATISRLVMSKMWLIVYHPHQRRDGGKSPPFHPPVSKSNNGIGASLPQETKDKLFITSLENIEYSILLETEARTMKWGWLFRTYVQWHAIAFLLSELCVRTKGEAVDRAWRALETTAGRWWFPLSDGSSYRKGKAGCLWKPLRKLMAKARAARERELALERASQALKNGGVVYTDFPQLLDQLPSPPPADQPSPENLDKMLRPSAPRLGEMPIAKPPSWAGSPALPSVSSPTHPRDINIMPDFPRMNGNNSGQTPNQAAYEFQALSGNGLDWIIGDVMQDMTYEGTSIYDSANPEAQNFNRQNPALNGQNQPSALSQVQTNGALNGVGAFTNSPTALGGSSNDSPAMGSSGQASSDSPVLDNGASMDWANWDDLVREYGMEGMVGPGQPGILNPSNASHLGMVNWF
jgi:hypothetical protein